MTIANEPELDAHLELAIQLRSASVQLKEATENLYYVTQRQPVDLPIYGAATATSTNPIALPMGGPSQGRRWLVRQLVITGGQFPYSAPGSAYVFTSSTPPVSGTGVILPGESLDDFAPSIPAVSFYSNRQVIVWPTQQLWIVINTPASGTSYVATGQVEDWLDAPYKIERGN